MQLRGHEDERREHQSGAVTSAAKLGERAI